MKKYQTKRFAHGFLLSLTFLLLFGCRTSPTNDQTFEASREITDDLGRKVKLPTKVDRAVSLAPNLTEIIFAVDAGDKLVGNTTYCDYPEAAKNVKKIGDTLNPNMETIIALKPQVVFVTNPKDLESVYRSIFQAGEILGKTEKANEVVDEMKRRTMDVEAKTSTANDIKTFVQIAREPLVTVGKDSFITDLVRRGGGISVTENVAEPYPKFSKESAIALQPDAIILSESADNAEPNDVFKNSPAFKNNKVFKIKADLLSRPGPRLVDGLEQIAKALHLESFQ